MKKLQIVADENILLLDEFFSPIADISKVDGRNISAAQVREADALVLRSTAQVDAALLHNSDVTFVGTCTIGIDHLDTAYMDSRKISWSNAPGCNANGVVDYAISALNHAWQVHGIDPRQSTIGVVGVGNVGGRLLKRLQAAGLKVLCSDPPRQAAGLDPELPYTNLQDLLQQADIICLHTPLIKQGHWATLAMLDAEAIKQLRSGTVLISAGRGEVVVQPALLERLQKQADLYVYLDVWQAEPNINPAIMPYCQIVTPHIAGHSLEGKVRGTESIYQALCQHFDLPVTQALAPLLPEPGVRRIEVSAEASLPEILNVACNSVYNLAQDDARTRQTLALATSEAVAKGFDSLRKHYPVRREFATLEVAGIVNAEHRRLLQGFGFKVASASEQH
ncbi:MAG: 4-phosphoerythronate dehydrogenase [Gammaproteobacteria bacterium]|jgi:erythronate-4-phosphate dehydrogenase|nr:4-phosphoerythronate dehydrogenase [Gammaproteobacteria bacterium]